jgi:hypothetical protein
MRAITLFSITLLVSAGCGGAARRTATPTAGAAQLASTGGAGGPMVAGAPGGGSTAAATPSLPEQLVIEAWLTLEVDEVQRAAAAIRSRVEEAGGRIINEQLAGGATSWSGSMKMRLPPKEVSGFVGWLDSLGEIQSKRVQGTDVSRQLFDQEIALTNLTRTLDRLRQLLDREGLAMKDILEIEKEMTRLRGEIERIKGEQRFLRDRVAFATVEVSLRRREGVILGPKAKLYPGVRANLMTLLDPEGRPRNRVGVGVVVHTITPGGKGKSGGRATIELDAFEEIDGEGHAVLATVGGAIYSDFLGRGKNRLFNPYLGLRLGYGYLDGSAFAFAGTAGVELFKHPLFLVDLNVRAVGLVGEEFQSALVTGASAVFAF